MHYVLPGADRRSFHDGFEVADGDRITLDFASHAPAPKGPIDSLGGCRRRAVPGPGAGL